MNYVLFNPLADNSKGEADARKWALDNKVDGEFVSLLDIKDMVGFLDGLNQEDEVYLTGGDGTLNHVVFGLLDNGIRKPVGYISTCTLSEGALFVAQTEPLGAGDEVYYGFADLGEDGFLYGAEYDTYTETTEGADKSARVVTERQAFLYDDMDELIERTKTRRKSDEDYNEVVLDRYARNRPEPAQELLYPSYVIVFTDDPKKITERSKKHAAYFGVPILMIDPVKYGSKS